MAADLKAVTVIKWISLILLLFTFSAYLKRKIDFFREQCEPQNKESLAAGLISSMMAMWTWIVSSLQHWSHDSTHEDPAVLWENHLAPSCQAPVTEIVTHILMTSISSDIRQICATASSIAAHSYAHTRDTLRVMVRGGKALFISCLDCSGKLMHNLTENLRSSCDAIRTFALGAFRDVSSVLSDKFLIVLVVISLLGLMSTILICWRKCKLGQARHKPFNNQCQMSNRNNNFVGSAFNTPLRSKVVHNGSTSSRLESDAPRISGSKPLESESHRQWDGLKDLGHLQVEGEGHRYMAGERRAVWRLMGWWVLCFFLLLLCLSLPWEFCRLYQMAVANKAAVASAGPPLGCSTEPLTLLQTLTLWLSQQLAWSHSDPCDRFYQAMFVDPLWEITPFMVLTSVVTRSVVHPFEILASGVGRALRHFFSHVPVHWQPLCLLLVAIFAFLFLLLSCRYRLTIPMLFRIEPRSPVLSRSQTNDGGRVNNCGCEKTQGVKHWSDVAGRRVLALTDNPNSELLSSAMCQRVCSLQKIPENYYRLTPRPCPGMFEKENMHSYLLDSESNGYFEKNEPGVVGTDGYTGCGVQTGNQQTSRPATSSHSRQWVQRSVSLERLTRPIRKAVPRNWSSERTGNDSARPARHERDTKCNTGTLSVADDVVQQKTVKGKSLKRDREN